MEDPKTTDIEAEIEASIQAELAEHLPELEPETQQRLVTGLSRRFQSAVERERRRCVETCRYRAALWRRTSAAESTVDRTREEARARANEAQYLADWLETRLEPPEVSEAVN